MDYGVSMAVTAYSMGPAAFAAAAEERGFESLFVPEHSHIPSSRSSSGRLASCRFYMIGRSRRVSSI